VTRVVSIPRCCALRLKIFFFTVDIVIYKLFIGIREMRACHHFRKMAVWGRSAHFLRCRRPFWPTGAPFESPLQFVRKCCPSGKIAVLGRFWGRFWGLVTRLLGFWGGMGLGGVLLGHFCQIQMPKKNTCGTCGGAGGGALFAIRFFFGGGAAGARSHYRVTRGYGAHSPLTTTGPKEAVTSKE